MNASLIKVITEIELAAALAAMAKGKAPGHDRIPMKFFKHLWPTIGEDFHHVLLKWTEDNKATC